MGDVLTVWTSQDVFEHAGSQRLAAGLFTHRHLPDEQGIGLFGDAVTRNEAYQFPLTHCGDRGFSKMTALQ